MRSVPSPALAKGVAFFSLLPLLSFAGVPAHADSSVGHCFVEAAAPSPALSAEPRASTLDATLDLNDSTFAAWRAAILPAADEIAWRRIPWRTSVRDGLREADAAAKPILLWLMNGHPLGCT